jgi:hypothetical protein
MRQEQPRRPSDQHQAAATAGGAQEQAGSVRYGDVFPMSIELAEQPVAPRDAATMQSAETMVFGQTLKGGPAAATANERVGVVGHDQATDATAVQGVTVAETRVPGGSMATEFVAGQVVGQYLAPDDAAAAGGGGGGAGGGGAAGLTKVTIGEALEATAIAAGDVPVELSDAAAVQAAEARATGLDANVPGGLAAQAQSAAVANETAARDEDKVTLGDVLAVHTMHCCRCGLTVIVDFVRCICHRYDVVNCVDRNVVFVQDAASKLVADKAVDAGDALRVAGAESRDKGDATARPGGVASSMAASARLNRDDAVWE